MVAADEIVYDDQSQILCPFSKHELDKFCQWVETHIQEQQMIGKHLLSFETTIKPNGSKVAKMIQARPGSLQVPLTGKVVAVTCGFGGLATHEGSMIPIGQVFGVHFFLDGAKVFCFLLFFILQLAQSLLKIRNTYVFAEVLLVRR